MTPLHVAIIPDGNRRWAKKQLLKPWKGHEKAMENFRALTDWCREDKRIKVMTIWGFSTENWRRDHEEIDELMKLFKQYLENERDGFQKNKTRVVHSGRTDRLPSDLMQLIKEIEAETAHLSDFTFHIALDYGGKDEVIRAMRKLKGSDITEDSVHAHLDHPELPDIDLIVRTSGEQRTSNFFLWQSTYAEWFFTPKFFPDFSPKDLEQAVDDFEKRKRRFGS